MEHSLIYLVALVAASINLMFWGWAALVFSIKGKKRQEPVKDTLRTDLGLSVVLSARNEAQNLSLFLPAILKQEVTVDYEVVVTNDSSTDNTGQVLTEMQEKYAQLRVYELSEKVHPGKKHALSKSITSAQFEWVLATDADCSPSSDAWASHMVEEALAKKVDIILGYSPYRKSKGWLNRWIRFEAFYTAVQYLAAALSGLPYMGVGRNMLYRRSLFMQVDGFKAHEHLAGGDDDLFVSAVATSANTHVCIDPQAWMISEPASSWAMYRRQKRRHLSVSTSYRFEHQVLLGLLAASHLITFLGVLLILVMGEPTLALLMLGVRWLLLTLFMMGLSKKLGERDLLRYVPVLDVMLLGYYLWGSFNVAGRREGRKSW